MKQRDQKMGVRNQNYICFEVSSISDLGNWALTKQTWQKKELVWWEGEGDEFGIEHVGLGLM